MAENETVQELPCRKCGAECCKSVVIEIDSPRRKKDYDELRWFVLHKDVQVFIDHDNKWNVEFRTPCLMLDAKGRCKVYAERPDLCRNYPSTDDVCVYEGVAFKRLFTTIDEIDAYIAGRQRKNRPVPVVAGEPDEAVKQCA